MYSIKIIKDCAVNPSDFYIRIAVNDIDKNGFNHFFRFILECLDCSVVWNNGMRPHQTINVSYKIDMGTAINMIEKYIEDDVEKQEYYQQLIDLHSKNLEYEKINPPIIYSKTKKVTKHKSTKTKKTDNDVSLKEKFISSKLNKLTLNLKSNDNKIIQA